MVKFVTIPKKSVKPSCATHDWKLSVSSVQNVTLVVFLVLLGIQILIRPACGADDWCYEGACGPKSWPGKCNTGNKQSPINIPTGRVKIRLKSTKLVVNRNYIIPKSYILKNNGHTVQMLFNANESSKCYLVGDGLGKSPYYFSQLHFHWGPNDRIGSEHLLSGKAYPLEMHMVHKLKKDESKIAVLAVLFYISPRDNPSLSRIVNNLGQVVNPGEPAIINPRSKISLNKLLPKRMRMFRYIGSLTTPPCTENVVWTVFQDPVPVSKRQLAAFRKLKGSNMKQMKKTFRPVQPAFTAGRKNIFFLRILSKRNTSSIFNSVFSKLRNLLN